MNNIRIVLFLCPRMGTKRIVEYAELSEGLDPAAVVCGHGAGRLADGMKALSTVRNVPVMRGCAHPLTQFNSFEDEEQGVPFTERLKPLLENAEGEVWFVCDGALTDIQLFEADCPELCAKVSGILFCGPGPYAGGRTAACAENTALDIESAAAVLQGPVPVYRVPADVASARGVSAAEAAMRWLEDRSFLRFEQAGIEADLWGTETRGALVADFGGEFTGRKGAFCAVE